MKRSAMCSVALIALAIVLSSCGDEEDLTGTFTISEKSYSIVRGFAQFDGVYGNSGDNYYYWLITLTSNSIKLDDNDDFEGTGDAVTLEIAAKNDDRFVPEGSYSYDDETANSYGVYTDFNTVTGGGTSYKDIADVTITIGKSGNTYTINFTITLDDETVITGSYKGSITEIDD